MIDLGGQDGAPVLGLGGGMFKASIILFDTWPGTKQFTVPEGVKKIRAFVVGAGGLGGGGYSEKVIDVVPGQVFAYTVGAGASTYGNGGTSSFGGLISATGGSTAGGVGTGGDVNFTGGSGTAIGTTMYSNTVKFNSGASAANRYENGGAGAYSVDNDANCLGASFPSVNKIDGWGLGMPPGSYGWGAFSVNGTQYAPTNESGVILASMGGGGTNKTSYSAVPGIGGGASTNFSAGGGNGAVGVEVLE